MIEQKYVDPKDVTVGRWYWLLPPLDVVRKDKLSDCLYCARCQIIIDSPRGYMMTVMVAPVPTEEPVIFYLDDMAGWAIIPIEVPDLHHAWDHMGCSPI